MEQAKIQLSAAEMALVSNASIILTKNSVLLKTKSLMETLQAAMQHIQQEDYSTHPLFATSPKISKGENYLGLPYLVLDYPRNFGQEDIFAIRTFFWWGHFFSSTLQLSGEYCSQYGPLLSNAYEQLSQHGYFVQVGTDPWAQHFHPDNYQPVTHFSPEAFADHCQQQASIKIAAKWPLEEWPYAANNLLESWKFLLLQCRL